MRAEREKSLCKRDSPRRRKNWTWKISRVWGQERERMGQRVIFHWTKVQLRSSSALLCMGWWLGDWRCCVEKSKNNSRNIHEERREKRLFRIYQKTRSHYYYSLTRCHKKNIRRNEEWRKRRERESCAGAAWKILFLNMEFALIIQRRKRDTAQNEREYKEKTNKIRSLLRRRRFLCAVVRWWFFKKPPTETKKSAC